MEKKMMFRAGVVLLTSLLFALISTPGWSQIQTNKKTIDDNFITGYWLTAVDFDADGDIDLLAASWNSGLKWYRNDGTGSFTRMIISNEFQDAWCIRAANLDNDTDLDILAVSANEETDTSSVTWFETKNGGLSFTRHDLDQTNGVLPHSIVGADVDQDGDNDILAVAWGTNNVLLWRNNDSTFVKSTFDGNFQSGHLIDAVDMDDDGMTELIGIGGGKTTIWQNNGGFDFTRQDFAGGGGFTLLGADLDLDGHVDLLRNDRSAGHLEWYKHNGDYKFDARVTLVPNFGECWSLDVADFDLDGDMDIVAAGYVTNPDRISFFINNGNGAFSEQTVGEFARPRAVQAADFDNDGDMDFAAVITDDGDILWFQKPGAPIPKTLTLLAPNGGETLTSGNTRQIQWSSTGDITSVNVQFSSNSGQTWSNIATNVPNSGSYTWTVPEVSTVHGRVRVTVSSNSAIAAASATDFTIIVADLAIIAPNGGETFNTGATQNIQWQTTGDIPQIKLEYSLDDGSSWSVISAAVQNTGSFSWSIPDIVSASVLVRISDAADGVPMDVSDGTFSIIRNILAITSPNGGETFSAGSIQNVTWSTDGNTNTVKLEYSIDGGVNWQTIVALTANTGSSVWVLPTTPTNTALVRVTNTEDQAISDVSDAAFTIQQHSTLAITYPSGGETWLEGTTEVLTWNTPAGINAMHIEFSADDGATWQTLQASAVNSGEYALTVPATESQHARIRISDKADGNPSHTSNSFTVVGLPALTLTVPNGGEQWQIGEARTIRWNSRGDLGTIQIQFSSNGGEDWSTIAAGLSNTGAYDWTVPPVVSNSCLVRILETSGQAKPDTSNASFSIAPRLELTLIIPNGGETLSSGNNYTVLWTSSSGIDFIDLDLSTDNGLTWTSIVSTAENTGQYIWTIPDLNTNQARLRINKTNASSVVDVSDTSFTILASTLDLTTPSGGEKWRSGENRSITWSSTGLIGAVSLTYSVDDGSWITVTEATPNDGSYTWTVPAVNSENVRFRVEDAVDGVPSDSSDLPFAISDTPVGVEQHPAGALPEAFQLRQNYPNPFNLDTRIEFDLAEAGFVLLRIYNLRGQPVRSLVEKELPRGQFSVSWDGRNEQGDIMASGVYVCFLKAGAWQASQKILLVK